MHCIGGHKHSLSNIDHNMGIRMHNSESMQITNDFSNPWLCTAPNPSLTALIFDH